MGSGFGRRPAEELRGHALALAELVLARGPLAIRLAKLALNASARWISTRAPH